jgi:hypothetical protein
MAEISRMRSTCLFSWKCRFGIVPVWYGRRIVGPAVYSWYITGK